MYMCHEMSESRAQDWVITSSRFSIWKRKKAFSVRTWLQKTDKLYSEVSIYEEIPDVMCAVILVVSVWLLVAQAMFLGH